MSAADWLTSDAVTADLARIKQEGEPQRPESLIEKTATAVAARLEEYGDGSEDNGRETVLRALTYLFDALEEDILDDWQECLIGTAQMDIQWRFGKALDWARRNGSAAGP
jgi:hypothetical protein